MGRHAHARRRKPGAPPGVSRRETGALARPRPRLGAALDRQRSTGRRERGNRRHPKMKRAFPTYSAISIARMTVFPEGNSGVAAIPNGLCRLRWNPMYLFSVMVGMARCAVPARVVAGGMEIRDTGNRRVAPLHAARTSQRDVPTSLRGYNSFGIPIRN